MYKTGIVTDVSLSEEADGKIEVCHLEYSKGKEANKVGEKQLTTSYMENLPSQNYKTRQFTRTISETLPANTTKEKFLEEAEKQAKICETLVKDDIARHIKEMKEKGG